MIEVIVFIVLIVLYFMGVRADNNIGGPPWVE